jgi:hypothetical protein
MSLGTVQVQFLKDRVLVLTHESSIQLTKPQAESLAKAILIKLRGSHLLKALEGAKIL